MSDNQDWAFRAAHGAAMRAGMTDIPLDALRKIVDAAVGAAVTETVESMRAPEGVSGPEQGAAGSKMFPDERAVTILHIEQILHSVEDWPTCDRRALACRLADTVITRAALRSAPPTTEGT